MRKNPIEVYDPNLLVGCDSLDMPSLKFIIRTVFDSDVQGYPYAPIKAVLEVLNSNNANTKFVQEVIKGDKKLHKVSQEFVSINSRLFEMVFNDKSFVGSQVEIAEAINWKVEDLTKLFTDFSNLFTVVLKKHSSKEMLSFKKKLLLAEDAFASIKKQFDLILTVVGRSYKNKTVR